MRNLDDAKLGFLALIFRVTNTQGQKHFSSIANSGSMVEIVFKTVMHEPFCKYSDVAASLNHTPQVNESSKRECCLSSWAVGNISALLGRRTK